MRYNYMRLYICNIILTHLSASFLCMCAAVFPNRDVMVAAGRSDKISHTPVISRYSSP